jgi:hypothetical protein
MRRVVVTAVLLSAVAFAQQQPSTAPAPIDPSKAASSVVTGHPVPASRSDIYCSGFIDGTPATTVGYVAGGLQTPEKVRFMERDLIFIKGQKDLEPGALVSIIREWKSPDSYELYKGSNRLEKEAGQPYSDMGYARVIEKRGADIAVAQVEFGCDAVVVGDIVVPFMPRPEVKVHQRTSMDRFPAHLGSLQGKIVMARDGDQMISTGRKVFLNIGWQNGVKVGDYFRVSRTFSEDEMDAADRATVSSTVYEDTQKNPQRLPRKKLGELPRHVVGELVILNVMPKTATAMVTFMLDDMHVGELVDREEGTD